MSEIGLWKLGMHKAYRMSQDPGPFEFERGVSSDALRQTFGLLPTGVVVISGLVNDRPHGLAVNSFISASLSPPMALFCIARSSTTWPGLAARATLGVSALSSDHASVAKRLSTRGVDRFRDVDWLASSSGAVLIAGAVAWLECEIATTVEAGDHQVVLMNICGVAEAADVMPLVFFRRSYPGLVVTS